MGPNQLIEVLVKATPNRAETASCCDVFWQPRSSALSPGASTRPCALVKSTAIRQPKLAS